MILGHVTQLISKSYIAPHSWPIKAVSVMDAGWQDPDPTDPQAKKAQLKFIFTNGKQRTQCVPKTYWADDEELLKSHSEVLFWKVHNHFVLVWFCANDAMMFSFHQPFFYEVRRDSIKMLPQPMRRSGGFASVFPRIGGCMIQDGQLLTWNVELPDDHGLSESHRYRLSYFDLDGRHHPQSEV